MKRKKEIMTLPMQEMAAAAAALEPCPKLHLFRKGHKCFSMTVRAQALPSQRANKDKFQLKLVASSTEFVSEKQLQLEFNFCWVRV